MAQKVTVVLVDDLDGTEAEETVTFGLDGTTYEIDLSASNATQLRSTMEMFTMAARSTSRRTRKTGKRSLNLTSVPVTPTVDITIPERTGPSPSLVRAWAKEHGIKVGDKGRVARSIVEQYEQAMREQELADELVS